MADQTSNSGVDATSSAAGESATDAPPEPSPAAAAAAGEAEMIIADEDVARSVLGLDGTSPLSPSAQVISDADLSLLEPQSEIITNNDNTEGETNAAPAPASTVPMSLRMSIMTEASAVSGQSGSEPDGNLMNGSPEEPTMITAVIRPINFSHRQSILTEASATDPSENSEVDADSISTESSEGSSNTGSSSSSSEDPSVIGGVRTQDIKYKDDGSYEQENGEYSGDEIEAQNGRQGVFTIDGEDEDDDEEGSYSEGESESEEEDPLDSVLLKEHVAQPRESPLYDDDEEAKMARTRSYKERIGYDRATVRKMVLQKLKNKSKTLKQRGRKYRVRAPRNIPLYWGDEPDPAPPETRGWTKRRRCCYAMMSVVIFVTGLSLLIYGGVRQREYRQYQATLESDDGYDDYYYYYDDDDAYNGVLSDEVAFGGLDHLPSPSNVQPSTPINLPSHPSLSPSTAPEDELLSLLKLEYKAVFHSFPPTTETLQIIDSIETDLLNANTQLMTKASEQSVQWKSYVSLRQRDDVIDRTTNQPVMETELILQLYSLTCFFNNFNIVQTEKDVCQWTGIKCDDAFPDEHNDVMFPSTEDIRVVSITLPGQSLTGTLPLELIFLPHLETIDLSNNFISGSLPKYFAEEQLENLKVLSFHDNRFEGSIPVEISKMKHLQKLTLQHNELVGEITTEICDMRDNSLHFLWVDCSSMSGTGQPKVPCPADCCTICFEGYDSDGGPSTGGTSPSSTAVDTPHIVVGDWSADLKQKLSSLSSDGGKALMDINSPQFHSYGWLMPDSEGKDYSDERLHQRYALATLYFATGGVQWNENEFWISDEDECNWYGVSGCSEVNNEAVISIELPGNNLAGSLPSEFFEFLSDVMVLNLSDNHITGSIPTSVGSLTSLNILELAENELTSHIPSELGVLTGLDQLFLQKNNLEGQMPNQVCSLRSDHELTLLWTDCYGFPPRVQCKKTCCTTCFANPRNGEESPDKVEAPTTHADPDRDVLSTLKKMAPDSGKTLEDTSSSQYKAYTWLAGSDYASFTDMIILQRYALATLYFSTAGGAWKSSAFWLSNTTECPNDGEHWLGVNRCDGGGMITHMELPSNGLVGTLPAELSHLRMLQVIDLSKNELYGTVPTQFGQFQELEILQLSENVLSGAIPDDLGFVFTLQEVYLHENAFTGSVPGAICDLKDNSVGIQVLWADCKGDPPAVTCRELCCTECFTNNLDYIASEPTNGVYSPTFMPSAFSTASAENFELKSFLLEHMDGMEDSLSDINLPTYKAYLLIANANNYDDLDPFNILQRFGLISLYLSTTPELDWKVSSGWTSEHHECTWFGISCSDNNTISEISLPDNRLGGTLPQALALAGIGEQLLYLDFSGNSIGGNIVSELGTLKNLAYLDIKGNDFTGNIPTELGHLSKLGSLQLHGNGLTGIMPEEICSLRSGDLNMLVADCGPGRDYQVTCEQPKCCTRCY